MSRRDRIFGWIGVLWGAAIVVSTLVRGAPSPSGADDAGALTAFVFGLALLVAGAWTLRRDRLRPS